MAQPNHDPNNTTQPLVRWYIDTRPLTQTTTALPLLETLQPNDQETVRKFYHQKDKHMSLASNLLKYLFVHRTCRIPWADITISRTPAPHRRPCFVPTHAQQARNPAAPTVEFNVSHQASLVALAGTAVPCSSSRTQPSHPTPQVGIDITCVNERQGKPSSSSSDPEARTLTAFNNYVDIFSEIFSAPQIATIKKYGYRLFYTYWALKEAYIKMTGEALLAPWLRDLEFTNVIAPAAAEVGPPPPPQQQQHGDDDGDEGDRLFGEPYRDVRTTLNGEVVGDVRIEVVAWGGDYLIATAARGARVGADGGDEEDLWLPFEKMDIERDIRPCAMGGCRCLG
ncbi:hypothetical protein ARAM_003790 [Aspergillus rambellii]|uniref:holo-[acyl-carrier-protein] synthase n=1 Tax=Aspergillus rambellii TaxID=308745 RepID=A0A0F8W1V5_9EURO|nr:hypothetical protein ARAM_003790 [Aspergillus rambellii]